jgi:hypothetical protein
MLLAEPIDAAVPLRVCLRRHRPVVLDERLAALEVEYGLGR